MYYEKYAEMVIQARKSLREISEDKRKGIHNLNDHVDFIDARRNYGKAMRAINGK